MSNDPVRDDLADELIALRRGRGDFEGRFAQSQYLVAQLGGGSLQYAVRELERVRRQYAGEPDSAVSTFFASAGYRTTGESLDQRLKVVAKRQHVTERTVLRRSDRGVGMLAGLLRDRLKYARPWVYFIAVQKELKLRVFIKFSAALETDIGPHSIYVNGQRVDPPLEVYKDDELVLDNHHYTLEPITLDTGVEAYEPMATVSMTWIAAVSPSWELVTQFADDRVYARLSVEPTHSVTMEVLWWDEFAATTREWPLAIGRCN